MGFSGKPHYHKTLNTAIRDVNPIYLERREPARNRQRFYAILVTPTLFGAWAMVREWGRIRPPGTVRETGFAHVGKRMKPKDARQARFVEFWHPFGVQPLEGV